MLDAFSAHQLIVMPRWDYSFLLFTVCAVSVLSLMSHFTNVCSVLLKYKSFFMSLFPNMPLCVYIVYCL